MTTRYYPTGIFDAGLFTDLIGAGPDAGAIDEDPESPNTLDGVKRVGASPDTDSLNLYMQPPSGSLAAPNAIVVRLYGACTGSSGNVSITGAYLLDDAAAVAATYTGGSIGLGISNTLQSIPLTYTPGTYDWTTARLVVDFTWSATSTVTFYAIDYAVVEDVGPGGQISRNAAFFQMLVNP